MFQLSTLFLIHLIQPLNQLTHFWNIIGQNNTSEGLNEDECDGLGNIGCIDIPKSNSEHNCGTPIVTPNIFLVPFSMRQIFELIPSMGRITCDKIENDGQKMSNHKVEEDNLG